MKKYVKPAIILGLCFAVMTCAKILLFDKTPFDKIKAEDVESANILSYSLFASSEIPETELTDIPALIEKLSVQKTVKKTNDPQQDKDKSSVIVTLNMKDGSQLWASISTLYIQTDDGIFICDSQLSQDFLKYAFEKLIFGDERPESTNTLRVDEIIEMAVSGNDISQIETYAKKQLKNKNFGKKDLDILAVDGYRCIDIFVKNDEYQQELLEKVSYQQYRTLAVEICEKYKNKAVTYDYRLKQAPADFKYPADIDMESLTIETTKRGDFYITIPSADKKYNMGITIDDTSATANYGTVTETNPNVEYVNFYLYSDSVIPADYPAVDVIKDGNALISADILTEKLTLCMGTSSNPENSKFSEVMFLCMLNYIENTEFCYYNIFPLLNDQSGSQFKTTNMEKVIRQILGDYNWDAKRDFFRDTNFNEETQSYEFSTDFGWGLNYHYAKNINSSFSADGKQVYSDCDIYLHDEGSDHGDDHLGRYRAVYDIVTENNERFLRFNRYQKI